MLATAAIWIITGVIALLDPNSASNVIVALVAAVASIVNTLILIRARATQGIIRAEARSIKLSVNDLHELSEEREAHIQDLRRVSRNLEEKLDDFQELADRLEHVIRRFRGGNPKPRHEERDHTS